MREVFVDTLFFAARINPHDQWHDSALKIESSLGFTNPVTSETVLHELLNFFSAYSSKMRQRTVEFVFNLLNENEIEILLHTNAAFYDGLTFYKSRPDKGYSLIDCISMNIMRERGITEVLTHDHDFEQKGFTILL